jgi:hypothetical protein
VAQPRLGDETHRDVRRARYYGPSAMTDFDLALETQAYQVLLEGHRAAHDDELIYQDMLKAKATMEIAWLQASARRPSNGGHLAA